MITKGNCIHPLFGFSTITSGAVGTEACPSIIGSRELIGPSENGSDDIVGYCSREGGV
jgi:hypothetical protein